MTISTGKAISDGGAKMGALKIDALKMGALKIAGVFVFAFGACAHSGSGGAASGSQGAGTKGYPQRAQSQAQAPASRTTVVPEPAALPPSPATATVVPAPQPVVVAPPVSPSGVEPGRSADRPMALAGDGPRFAVRGVDRSDVLYVRSGPGPKNDIVGQLPPDTRGVVGTGARQKVGPGEWYEITHGGVRGWVNARFLVEESR